MEKLKVLSPTLQGLNTIPVTAEHITEGGLGVTRCSVVLALRDAGYNKATAAPNLLCVNWDNKMETSTLLMEWMEQFDKGEFVEPFNLVLNFEAHPCLERIPDEETGGESCIDLN